MTFRFISDPGHGWLEVRGDQLEEVGAHPLAFSSYSYQTQGKTLTEAHLRADMENPDALADLIVAKNRWGQLGSFTLRPDLARHRFGE